jgi:hypothetical protein
MILSDLRFSVRNRLDDTSFDQATVDESINWFVFEVCNDHRLRIMEATDDIFISAGDFTADMPDDFQTIINLHVTSPQVYNILNQYTEYGDFMKNYPGYQTYTASQLYTWTDYGNGMRFAAPVSADTTCNIDYLRRPVTMVADTDVCEFQDQYFEMVVIGALARCMDRNEDYAESATERGKLAPLLTSFIRNEGRGGIKLGPTVMRSNRRGPRGGYRADRDF